MADYLASIQTDAAGTDAAGTDAADPTGFSLRHHLAGTARLEMSKPTGGHFLHAAVGMCIFNGIVDLAADRSIRLDDLRIDVRGDFAGEAAMASTGVTYDITVESPSSEEEIRTLIAEVTADSPISRSLEQGTPVRLGSVTVDARR